MHHGHGWDRIRGDKSRQPLKRCDSAKLFEVEFLREHRDERETGIGHPVVIVEGHRQTGHAREGGVEGLKD